MTRCRRGAALLVATVLSVAGAHPVSTAASTTNTAVCSGSIKLTFTSALKVSPAAADAFSLDGTLNCTGLFGGSLALGGNGLLMPMGTCLGGLVLGATGSAIPPGGTSTSVTYTAAGPSVALAWTVADATGTTLEAQGVFSWLNSSEIQACLSLTGAGTTTMTLTGALALETL